MSTVLMQHTLRKRVSVLIIVYNGKGYLLTGHSEKGYQIQNVEHTVKGKFCSPLFDHRYTAGQQAPRGLFATIS